MLLLERDAEGQVCREPGAVMINPVSCVVNKNLRIERCNTSFLALTGFKAEDVCGSLISDFVHPADYDNLISALDSKSFPESPPQQRSVRLITVNSTYFELSTTVEQMVSRSSTEYLLHFSCEKDKHEVNGRDFLYNTIEESYIILGLDRRILSFNRKAAELGKICSVWNLSEGALFDNVLAGRFLKLFLEYFPRALKGETFEIENSFRYIDGSELWIATTLKPLLDEEKNVRCVTLISRDVSGNRRVQQELRASEKKLKSLLGNCSDFILVMNEDYEVTFFSESVVKLLGSDLRKAVAFGLKPLIHEADLPVVLNCCEVLRKLPGKTVWTRFRIRKYDGEFAWWEGSFCNMLQHEAIKGFVLNFRDITDRLKVERQLEFDRRNWDALINNTSDMLWSIDKNLRLVTANIAFRNEIQKSSGARVTAGDYVMVPGTSSFGDKWKAFYLKALGGERFTVETDESGPFTVATEVSFNPIIEEQNVIGVACSARDISERKSAQKILQLSFQDRLKVASRLTSILNTLPACVVMLDEKGRIIEANDSWYKLVSKCDPSIKSINDGEAYFSCCVNDELLNERKEIINGVKKILSGESSDFIFEYDCKNGNETRWYEVQASALHHGEERGAVVMHTDITDRKLAEQKIAASEALFKALVTNSLHVVQLIDSAGRIQYTSPSVKMVLGYTESELESSLLTTFVNPEDQRKFQDALQALDGLIISEPLEVRIINRKNLWVWVEMQLFNLKNNKDVNSVVVNFRDITSRINAEAKLKASNKELQTFIYSASHDLRGPLASIIGLTRIGKVTTDQEKNRQLMQMIESSASKLDGALMKLVESMTIKDASRFADMIDFEEIINEALAKYEFFPGYADMKVTVVVNKNYQLTSNKLIIQSIVQNLVENAIKYRNQYNESFLHIQVGGTAKEAVLVFEDNGIGIDRSIQNKVFEMYYRGTQKSGGSGLGLYLVKTGVDKLGGSISVMSEPGVGSTFIITIPTSPNEISAVQ